ncbi:hypothetical protein P5V15_015402 [Pogonomyrmex californicus]
MDADDQKLIDEQMQTLRTNGKVLQHAVANQIKLPDIQEKRMIPTRLLPIKHIITALKEAATQLTMGLHFPFKIQTEHWQTIHTYITFSAYSDGPYIYTILRFPVVAYPTFKLVKAIPLPVHDHANVFAYIKINHPLIAIDKENHHYKLLEEVELERCIRETNTYTCEQNFATYYAETTAPCRVQIYTYTGTAQVLRKESYDI